MFKKKLNLTIPKKIIFLVFGSNHRYSALGNFGKSKIYNNILLISLGGRIKSYIGKIFYFFKIGKFISIDANPFLKDEKNSINVWFNGTWKILSKFKEYENNLVNIYNPIVKENQKIFQIYPIIFKKKFIYSRPKIIFMGKIWYTHDENLVSTKFLDLNKEKILENFSLIDQKNFWLNENDNEKNEILFKKYRMIKTYLREQIILKIKENFKNNFYVYGEDKKKIGINFQRPIYQSKLISKIYQGNICIDTGPIPGSMSLHPRSIKILESNGLLVQAKQLDSNLIWGGLEDKIISNNIDNLLKNIELLLVDQIKFNDYLNIIYEKFEKSDHKIYETLKVSLKL